MKIRKMVISAVLVVIGLPVALVLIAVASISVLDPSNGSIVPSGEKRQYLLYVPESYDRAKPTPLVTDATGGRDIRLGGGVSTIRQYLRAALIDELHLAIAPVLLGRGEHLLHGIDVRVLGYECVSHVAGARAATHVILRKRA